MVGCTGKRYIALPDADSTVRGRKSPEGGGILGTGYRLAGPVLAVGAGKRLPLGERWHLVPEVQLVATRVNVKIADGDATTANLALHFLLGGLFSPTKVDTES